MLFPHIKKPLALVLIIIPFLIGSCIFDQKRESTDSTAYDIPVAELTQEQQSAFDALNTLQTNTDEMNRLFSTFPNISQPCYPADTSFSISQSELLSFLKKFASQHCQTLTPELRNELAESAVLAQKNYNVLYCSDYSPNANYENGIPMSGTWVIPNILERRDVIMHW